ncbi:hypothetical protein POM88_023591 [Heracleum sosnowskyi]|uniref:AP2/ERF domain-containing protein n=1 Tax=Heracleum sosnowskyi TaxID=360622 RepID=A0AAD8IJ57_9APIA|nr:hypothetical protein POM88_023591 [Heracleum sosnowskyi]
MVVSLSILVILFLSFSSIIGQPISSGTEAENTLVDVEIGTKLIKQKDDTVRVDPLDHLKKYRGGYEIRDLHYWRNLLVNDDGKSVITDCGIVASESSTTPSNYENQLKSLDISHPFWTVDLFWVKLEHPWIKILTDLINGAATKEEAGEAYDIATIKFRGANTVTNFELNRYDVEAIAKSSLLIGVSKCVKLSLESESKTSYGNNLEQQSISNSGSNISFDATIPVSAGTSDASDSMSATVTSEQVRLERFRTITSSYYRGAHGIIVSSPFSFFNSIVSDLQVHVILLAISSPVLSAVGERYYKVTAEALRVCRELVCAVRPNVELWLFTFS